MAKHLYVSSGHHLFIKQINREDLPTGLYASESYTKFYVVKNFDDNGVVFFYLAKGHPDAPNQNVVWFGNHHGFWSGFGKTQLTAIEGAMLDAWKYA
jgi:hypothetical protein